MTRLARPVLLIAAWLMSGAGLAASAPGNASGFDPRLGKPLERRARPVFGSDQAPVVVIEVSNFQCPHCREFREDTFPALKKAYIDTGKVQWVMINAAADREAAREPVFAIAKCLARQNGYGDFVAVLFASGGQDKTALMETLRRHGGFDEPKLQACLGDPAAQTEVAADFDDYGKLRVSGTPTFFVRKLRARGKRSEAKIVGNLPLGYFERTFDTMLRLP